MKIEGEQILLRVYVRGTDQHHLSPVYTRLVQAARKRRMAGATVLHGIYGYGQDGIHEDSRMSWAHDVPAIVEIVDSAAAVTGYVKEVLGQMFSSGIATLERAHVMMWRRREGEAARGKLGIGRPTPPGPG